MTIRKMLPFNDWTKKKTRTGWYVFKMQMAWFTLDNIFFSSQPPTCHAPLYNPQHSAQFSIGSFTLGKQHEQHQKSTGKVTNRVDNVKRDHSSHVSCFASHFLE
jgi:hypothetical protein